MSTTLYGIELTNISGTPLAIGTTTEQGYQCIMNGAKEALKTRIEHRNGAKEVTIITDNEAYYKLGRHLHRQALLIEALQA